MNLETRLKRLEIGGGSGSPISATGPPSGNGGPISDATYMNLVSIHNNQQSPSRNIYPTSRIRVQDDQNILIPPQIGFNSSSINGISVVGTDGVKVDGEDQGRWSRMKGDPIKVIPIAPATNPGGIERGSHSLQTIKPVSTISTKGVPIIGSAGGVFIKPTSSSQRHKTPQSAMSTTSVSSTPQIEKTARATQRPIIPPASTTPTIPAIPKSQDVKYIQEPSYSTVLQLQNQLNPPTSSVLSSGSGVSAQLYKTVGNSPHLSNNTPIIYDRAHSSLYANYSNLGAASNSTTFSELEALRDPDEYTSPPSPVSSSYSELRQTIPASQHGLNLPTLVGGGGANVRTDQSNYSTLYDHLPRNKNGTELYKSISSSSSGDSNSSSDYFGSCAKCSGRIIGEGTGCTAMGRIYHIACFTCYDCDCLLQGKPFYALDGNPYCQKDYMNTLEKCCKCFNPILDRILRATGKPYHPTCFTCVVCGRSLDGIPFTVDATNQIHCIEDFHRRFAPRCSVCKQPIMPEEGQEETVRVVALDRSFHIDCYRCEDCSLLLSSESQGRGCYPLDDHVLCKNCNTKRIQALTYGI